MVDDPSSDPDPFRMEKAPAKERQRLFKIIEDLVPWKSTTNEEVLNAHCASEGSAGLNLPP